MTAAAAFFYLFAAITVASGFMVIASRNPVTSVLFLILAFVNASGLFILLGAEADDRLTLGIDVAGRSSKPGARPLFEGDKESQTLQQSITLCEQFHGAFVFTREFSAALKASGIVEERPLELEIVPGRPTNVGTFGRVIEEKFKELPDATVLDWYKRGFLYAVYFHLQSMNNWEMMVARNAILMQAASQVA